MNYRRLQIFDEKWLIGFAEMGAEICTHMARLSSLFTELAKTDFKWSGGF